MCVDEDKCLSGYGYWTVSVGVGPSLSERLSTYLYQRGLGPNVVQKVNFSFRNSKYVCGLLV